eukprot:CAMPEP_0114981584 /NCGR_PEP_ID=MMETSP0216-20121206/5622_1 /TAXON_ID=223996 /ORGANISM="Protocruzia adherens, Strain Boccale" /LENGTH=460 /DNA_ID=CAMNT_0002343265 /DNA_START=156 /DNA_END=1538 /DNA_ORIENTATION=+
MNDYDEITPVRRKNANEYRESPQRYAALFIYCYASAVSAIICYSFFSITEAVNVAFNVTDRDVETLGIVFTLVTVPLYLPSAYIIEKYGMRSCMLWATGGTATAALLRLIAPTNFALLYVTQIFAAVVYPIIQNAPATIGAIWFKAENRTTAVAVATVSCSLGVITAFWVPSAFVSGVEDDSTKSAQRIENLVALEGALALLCFILTIGLFQDRPEIPPSPTMAMRRVGDFKESLMMLATSRDYLKVLFLTSIIVGIGHSFSVIIDPLFKKMDIGHAASKQAITLCIVSGAIGSAIWGYIVDRIKSFKTIITTLSLSCIIVMLLASFATTNVTIMVICITLAGFTGVATVGLLFNLASEICYPVSEAISLAVIFMTSLGAASVLMVVARGLMEWGRADLVLVVFVGVYLVSVGVYVTSGEELKRTIADRDLRCGKKFDGEESVGLLTDDDDDASTRDSSF